MNKATREEIQLCSCGFPQSFPIPHEHDRTEREKQIIDHYEILSKNTAERVSREFVERWAEDFFLSAQEAIEKGICWSTYKVIIPRIESMLAELGLEVEEKEENNE